MHDDLLTLSEETEVGFGKSFIRVLAAHLALFLVIWLVGKFYFKRPAAEPIVWLDGGGELGSAAAPAPAAAIPAPPPPEPEEKLPPVPAEELVPPKETTELPIEVKPKPTPAPTPKPKPKPTPMPTPRPKPIAVTTPRPKPAAPAPKPVAKTTPAPKKKPTPTVVVAKLATPSQSTKPSVKPTTPKTTDSAAAATGSGAGKSTAPSGSGDATNAGKKGGPGAPGGSEAVMMGYFRKVEALFDREWKQPLTVVSTGRDVEAHVRFRASADGTVQSLTLLKPTGNHEVDQSIEAALRRVHKVDSPPAVLLKNGALDETIVFVLTL